MSHFLFFPCFFLLFHPFLLISCFSFPACAFLPLQRHQGRSAHVSSCFFLFGVCLPSLATTSGPLRTRQLLLFPFWRVPSFPCNDIRAAPHTSALAFSFWRVPAFPCNGIRAAPHTSALAFFFWRVPAFSGTGVRAAPHTSPLAFSFFWRVPAFPCNDIRAAPHTSALTFSFLACAFLLWNWRQGRSAHVSSCFFLFGVCLPSLATTSGPLRTRQLLLFPFGVCLPSLELASGPLRTRQLLLFPFWRVPSFPCNDIRAAPHTSALAFSFFGVCLPSLELASGPLRTRQLLLFPFWRVPSFPCNDIRAAPHTSALAFSFPACVFAPHVTFQKNLQKV